MIPPLRRSAPASLRAYLERTTPDPRFTELLASRFFDISRLFDRLYASGPDRDTEFDRLLDVLRAAWADRSDSLRHVDRRRSRDGRWYANGRWVGMQLYVDRFAGTIAGLTANLDYFADLGVNVLHLMPMFRSRPGGDDGGYAISDYLSLRPEIGTLEDLATLATAMRDRDMALAIDFVLNHTSDRHPWAQRALEGDRAYQDYFLMFEDRVIPDIYDRSMPEVFPQSAPGNFTYRPEIDRWVMTVFHSYQWDLNYANPAVFVSMIEILLALANVGIDLFRLDAVPYLWKRIGTSGQNLDEAHVVARLIHACIQVVCPGVATIAEAIVQPSEIVRYFGEGEWAARECELAYNASMMVLAWDAIATGKPALLRRGLRELPQPPTDTTWLNYVRCHDDIGLGYDEDHIRAEGWDPRAHRSFMVAFFTGSFPGSVSRGARFMDNPRTGDARISGTAASLAGLEAAEPGSVEEDIAVRRIILLHALIFAVSGIPIIYAGDEIGAVNDYSFRDMPHLASDNRWMHRPYLTDAHRTARFQPGSAAERIFGALKSLILVRSGSRALRSSSPVRIVDSESPNLLVFARTHESERVLVVLNAGSEPTVIPDATFSLSGFESGGHDIAHDRPVVPGARSAELAGYGFAWLAAPTPDDPVQRAT